VTGISAATMASLASYDWPGNVRELSNLVERAVVLASGGQLEFRPSGPVLASPRRAVATPDAPRADADTAAALKSLESVQREHILRVLAETGWLIGGKGGAAARLRIKESTLRSRMKKLGIRRSGGDVPPSFQ
jgi:formate hydrogenlyase transcriptional activator